MKLREKMKRFWTLDVHNHEGFTLVELIIVIAILAILSTGAIAGYSVYVEQANKTVDDQLLYAINQAFRSACIENGTDAFNLADGSVSFNTNDMTVSLYNDSFQKYFDNSGTFKTYTLLSFKGGMFVEGSAAYAGLVGTFNSTDISNFNNSVFAAIGLESLMGQVDVATQVAMGATPGSTLHTMVSDPANMNSLAAYLGFESIESEGFEDAYYELLTQKANAMAAANGGVADDYYELAENAILANTAVLVAATTDFNIDSFKANLAAGDGKDTIKDSMDNETTNQEALAQTAMAYAMYTSYMEYSGGTATSDITTVLDTLESDGFKAYMGTEDATDDLNGYLAAMSMVNSTSGNKDAVSNLLVNGFTDADLLALLNQEIGG